MSSTTQRSNREVIEEAYDAFERGAIEEVLAAMDEDVEWTEAEGGVYGGEYHGTDEVLENVFAPLGEEWDTFVVEPERFVEDGNTVVAMGTYRGTYSATGRSFEAPFAHAFDVEDGKIVRFEQYVDTVLYTEPVAE